ncbi:MAG: STAS domain-containing protein [Clostridia bacterium]|nr:STAS domain-containing protein [Clostridia bacterium]
MIYKISDGNIEMDLRGELDIANAEVFKKNCIEIADEHKLDFIIDCKNLDFIDSSALGALVTINNKVAPEGKKVILKNLKPNVKKLITVSNVDKYVQIEE